MREDMGKGILTTELVKRAITLAAPSINAVLAEQDTGWGPRWVAVVVSGPGLEQRVVETVGRVEGWKAEWGEQKDFRGIALRKAILAERTGMPTEVAVSRMPWLLQEGDYLFQGGTGEPGGLTVTASGAHGATDEGISELVKALVVMLCRLKVKQMKEAGIDRL
jgi:hypothetical protein